MSKETINKMNSADSNDWRKYRIKKTFVEGACCKISVAAFNPTKIESPSVAFFPIIFSEFEVHLLCRIVSSNFYSSL